MNSNHAVTFKYILVAQPRFSLFCKCHHFFYDFIILIISLVSIHLQIVS